MHYVHTQYRAKTGCEVKRTAIGEQNDIFRNLHCVSPNIFFRRPHGAENLFIFWWPHTAGRYAVKKLSNTVIIIIFFFLVETIRSALSYKSETRFYSSTYPFQWNENQRSSGVECPDVYLGPRTPCSPRFVHETQTTQQKRTALRVRIAFLPAPPPGTFLPSKLFEPRRPTKIAQNQRLGATQFFPPFSPRSFIGSSLSIVKIRSVTSERPTLRIIVTVRRRSNAGVGGGYKGDICPRKIFSDSWLIAKDTSILRKCLFFSLSLSNIQGRCIQSVWMWYWKIAGFYKRR